MAAIDQIAAEIGAAGAISAPALFLLAGLLLPSLLGAKSSAEAAAVPAAAAATARATRGESRQLAQFLSIFQNSAALTSSSPDQLYGMLWAMDKETGCGLKLTCTLAALPKSQAVPQDMLLLRMFGRRPFTVDNSELDSAVGIYKYAAFMGAKSMNLKTCDDLFKACEMGAQDMVPVWRGVVDLLPTIMESLRTTGK